jgi:hypothetical protein
MTTSRHVIVVSGLKIDTCRCRGDLSHLKNRIYTAFGKSANNSPLSSSGYGIENEGGRALLSFAIVAKTIYW